MRGSSDLLTTEEQVQLLSQKAFRLAMILAATVLAIGLFELYLALFITNAWQMMATAVLSLSCFGIIMLGGLLVRLGKLIWGIALIIGALYLVGLLTVGLFILNIGYLLALTLLILIPQLALQTLPSKYINRVISLSVVGAVLIVLTELFGLETRLAIPVLETIVPYFAALLILIYGFLILRQLPHFSIRVKFVIGAVTLVVLTVIGLTVVINQNTRSTFINVTGEKLNNIARSQSLAVGELLARQVGLLQTLSLNQLVQVTVDTADNRYASSDLIGIQRELEALETKWQAAGFTDPLVQAHLNNSVARELLEFQGRFRTSIEIVATDQYGGLVGATNKTARYSYGEEPWWQTAYNNGRGAIFIGSPEVNSETGFFQINIAVPIFASHSRQAIGVLQSTYSLRELGSILAATQADLGESVQVDLLFPPNKVVAIEGAEPEELTPEVAATLEEIRNEVYSQLEFEETLSLVSQAQINTLLHVPDVDALGWYVIIHQPLSDSLAPVREQQRVFILAGMLAMLIASAGAAVVGQTLTRPIAGLTEAAVQVASGDLTVQAKVETEDELGTLAKTFNEMTARLRQTIMFQEQRIAERTRALEVSSEVSRRLSTILDEEVLVKEMVSQIQEAFNYYHAHIYLFDRSGERLIMVGGTGTAGQKMLDSGHQIPRGKGLVGRAAETKTPVLVQDVSRDPDWLPNPLLPETKAEVAVPIAVGENVLGVLDVQQNISQGLSQEDADLLQTIANQVAIALQNARAYERAQRQAIREATINLIGQKIQNATTIESALQIAVRELGQVTGASQTAVKLRRNIPANGEGLEQNGRMVDGTEKERREQR